MSDSNVCRSLRSDSPHPPFTRCSPSNRVVRHRVHATKSVSNKLLFSIFFCLFGLASLHFYPTNANSPRYANTGDAVAGHVADAGQRFALVLFRVLHLWHHWRSIVGRDTSTALRSSAANACCGARVSFIFSNIQFTFDRFYISLSFIHFYLTIIYDYVIPHIDAPGVLSVF